MIWGRELERRVYKEARVSFSYRVFIHKFDLILAIHLLNEWVRIITCYENVTFSSLRRVHSRSGGFLVKPKPDPKLILGLLNPPIQVWGFLEVLKAHLFRSVWFGFE